MSWQSKSAAVAIAIMAMSLHSSSVQAMPEQGKVVAGQGEIVRPDDKTMVINQKTDRLALDWQKFNIAKDEKVHFDQNSKSAIAINRVVGDGRSIIDGSLSATGNVFVINPNGVLFGKNSSVDVGGLVASTANVTDEDMRNFTQGKGDLGLQIAAGREASVINAGTIKAKGGLVALHATTVENTGTIANEGGQTVLAAAKNLSLAADTAGKLNFTVNGSLANAKALNSGTLKNDGGYLVMTAKSAGDLMSTVVNNTGVIEAKTLHANDKGEILLDGGENGQVEVSGTLDASGTEAGQSAGSIKVIGQKTVVNDGTNLLARGAIDGGKIETSGDVLNLGNNLNIDAKGESGKHGEWLLDPLEVVISAEKKDTYQDYKTSTGGDLLGDTQGKGTKNNVIYNDPPGKDSNASSTYSSTTWINSKDVTRILNSGTDITIQAISTSGAASISLESPLTIDIASTASKNPTFTLEANRNITIAKDIKTSGSKGLNIILNADTDGDGMGAVIINADITTNGGFFKSSTGGSVTHGSVGNANKYNQQGNSIWNTPVKVGGEPNHDGHTVGTYFGIGDTTKVFEDRNISTNGGDITLNGEVAIGLNGGTLNLNTANGMVNVSGIINSGNSYNQYIYDYKNGTWNQSADDTIIQAINDEVEAALRENGAVPVYRYKGVNYTKTGNKEKGYTYTWTYDQVPYETGSRHYVFRTLTSSDISPTTKNISDPTGKSSETTLATMDPFWYMTTDKGNGYNSFIITGKTTLTINDFLVYLKKSDANYSQRYGDSTTYDAHSWQSDTTTQGNNLTKFENLKRDIALMIANNWYAAKELAENGSKGQGNQTGDSYLATITTRLENSLTAPSGSHILYVGGRGSGIHGRTSDKGSLREVNRVSAWYPADPTHMDGFYWVTGPEGLNTDNQKERHDTVTDTATGKTEDVVTVTDAGTKFWDTSKTDAVKNASNNGEIVYGMANWSKNAKDAGVQPDNNGPFLTVGYGSDSLWDDANYGGETTRGFVRETNLAHSSLNIQAGSGTVNLQGNIGGSEKLDTVTINTTNTVKTGGSTVTDYNVGIINADHGVTINGGDVTIGGRITTGSSTTSAIPDATDNVSITSAGNLTVHGITANGKTNNDGKVVNGGKISLISNGDNDTIPDKGTITIEGTDNSEKNRYTGADNTTHAGDGKSDNGGLIAGSSDNGAVVIDSRGKTGAFINKTTSDKAIDTKGTWQVYVASPSDYGTVLGDNLNSETNAQWSSESTKKSTSAESDKNAADRDIGTYTDHTHNKFIFQVTPTITVSGQDMTKTYGDTLSPEDLRNKLTITSATFKASDNTSAHSVDEYSKNFQEESDKSKYIASKSDATSTGMKNIFVSSIAQDPTATRTGGYKESSTDNKKAIYPFSVGKENAAGLNGYALDTKNADIEIIKRKANITGTGTQTYGGEKGKFDWTETKKENIAPGSNVFYTTSVKSDSAYTEKQQNRNTADYGTYGDSVSFDNLKITDSKRNEVNIADNYDLTTTGTIEVGKATLTVKINDASTQYGTPFDEESGKNKKSYDYTVVSGNANGETEVEVKGLLGKLKNYKNAGVGDNGRATQDVGSYGITGEQNTPLTNYTVKIEKGTATIAPRDVYFHVTGNGKTIGDVVYTVTDTNPKPDYPLNPNDPINSQLVYGETVTPSYTPDGRLPNGHYGVSTSLPGYGPIESGKVYGNYRYHYDGDVTLTTPSKPDIVPPVNPPVMPGTGTVTATAAATARRTSAW